MKNTYWLRHFLKCDFAAKKMCNPLHIDNFARLILDEQLGRALNAQMTNFFWIADEIFATLDFSDKGIVFDCLEEEGVTIPQLAMLSERNLRELFNDFVMIESALRAND